MKQPRFKHTIWIIFGIFTFNFILKFLYIDVPAIGGDEPFSIFYSQADLETLVELSRSENNPPFFTLLLKFWANYFGISPVSVRFLPLIFSSLTAVFIYVFMRRVSNVTFGLVASLLFTFSNYHIYFSHEARPYALFGLLTILALYYTQRTLESEKRRWFIFMTITNVLLIYNHFFGFFVLLVEFFMLTVVPIENKQWRKVIKSWIITVLFYIPYVPFFFIRFFESSSQGTWLTVPYPQELYSIFVKFSNAPVVGAFGLLLLLGGIILNRLVWKDRIFTFLVISLFTPLILTFTVSQFIPMFLDRYFVYLGVIFFLALSYFLYKIQMPVARYSVTGLIILGFILTADISAGNKAPDDILAETVKEHKKDGDAVIIFPWNHNYNFIYHYNRTWMNKPMQALEKLHNENIFPVYDTKHVDDITLSDTCFLVSKGKDTDLEHQKIISLLKSSYKNEQVLFKKDNNTVLEYSGLIDLE